MRNRILIGVSVCVICWFGNSALHAAEPRAKLGADSRHALAEQITFTPSTQVLQWKMATPWSKEILFYDIAVHFCDSVRLASAGRLDITPFAAEELVPAMQTFDAVSAGLAEVGHDWPGYWKTKNEAFVAFGSVPFGLDAEGYNIWLYERGGLPMMQELYRQFNLYALPGGQIGQEFGFFSTKPVRTLEDFVGMRVRTTGWYMDILKQLGVVVSPLFGGEIYAALEQGILDAAEFSSPTMDYAMALDDIAKYAIQPGFHQPGTQCVLSFNLDAWNSLPEDLQWIVTIAAQETQLWGYNWVSNLNAEALRRFKANQVEIVKLDQDALIAFRKTTKTYLDGLKAQYPDVKKILDSQEEFLAEYEDWRSARSGVAPWPYDTYISGQTTE